MSGEKGPVQDVLSALLEESRTSSALGSRVPLPSPAPGPVAPPPFPCKPVSQPGPLALSCRAERSVAARLEPPPRLSRFKAGARGSQLRGPLHLPSGSRGSQRLFPRRSGLRASASALSSALGARMVPGFRAALAPGAASKGQRPPAFPRQTQAPPVRTSAPTGRARAPTAGSPRRGPGHPARAVEENWVSARRACSATPRERGEATAWHGTARPGPAQAASRAASAPRDAVGKLVLRSLPRPAPGSSSDAHSPDTHPQAPTSTEARTENTTVTSQHVRD